MRDGNQIVKFGVTTRPEAREAENQAAGLGDNMRIEGPAVTEQSALGWEASKIAAYEAREGRKPPGNK